MPRQFTQGLPTLAVASALLALLLGASSPATAQAAGLGDISAELVDIEHPAALPAGGVESGAKQVAVDGIKLAMDHLGPVIVNTDGTISRISNWDSLSERERQVALRRIAKRNNERKEKLLTAELDLGEGPRAESGGGGKEELR